MPACAHDCKYRPKARLSLCRRERTKVRVSTSTAPAAQTKLLARRCRVPGELDDSKTAAQRSPCEPEIPSAFGREFVRHNSYARHRPIRSRALRSNNRNPRCSNPMDADGEICSLQNFGSANAAKECAQCRLPSCVTNEHDSRRIILVTNAIFEKQDFTPHLSPLPLAKGRGERPQRAHAVLWQLMSTARVCDG